MYIQPTSGNVGINTTSPSQLFTVGNNNQFTVASNGAVVSQNSATIYNSLSVGNSGGTGVTSPSGIGNLLINSYPGSPVADRLSFGTDGSGWQFRIAKNQGGTVTDLLTVQDNGNVGIGAVAPTSVLYVQGTSTNPTFNLFTVASSSGTSYLTVAANGSTTISSLSGNLPVHSTASGRTHKLLLAALIDTLLHRLPFLLVFGHILL